MWTLANHPRVPEKVRQKMARVGSGQGRVRRQRQLAAPVLRPRSAPHGQRLRHDRTRLPTAADRRDSVGLGSYNMDSHNVQRYVTPEGFAQNEGDVQVSPGGAVSDQLPFAVPKHVAKPRTCWCRSACPRRTSPTARSGWSRCSWSWVSRPPRRPCQAIQAGVAVQDVDYTPLRERLLDDGQVLDLPASTRSGRAAQGLRGQDLAGIVVDEEQATFTGSWIRSTSVGAFVENGYHHDNDSNKGALVARFEVPLAAGRYAVRVAYSPHPNRTTNVPVTIHHRGGIASNSSINSSRLRPDRSPNWGHLSLAPTNPPSSS